MSKAALAGLVFAASLAACGGGSSTPADGGNDAGPPPAVADKCKVNADCGSTLACAAQVPGGGYCTLNCAPAGTSCPAGSVCVLESDGTKDCEKSCSQDSDCRAEHLCFKNGSTSVCRPKCTQDADCNSRSCNVANGVCAATRVGNACAQVTQTTDCGQLPASCDTTNPAGSCTLPCGGEQQSACPVGTNCTSTGGSSSCQKACANQADCRAGFNCITSGGVSSCLPKCTGPTSCAGAQVCDTASGNCIEGGPAAGTIGGACKAAGDCTGVPGGSGSCAQPPSYPGGYCFISCVGNTSVCGSNATCVDFGTDGSGNPVQDCLSKCTIPSDCRGAYYCFQLSGGAGGVCTPKCQSNADCSGGKVCDTNGGLCVDPSSGTGTTIESINMTAAGAVTVFTDHLVAPLTVNVAATADGDPVSVTFVGQAVSDPTARVVVYRITAPDGTVLYDYQKASSSKMKVLPSTQAGVYSVLLPNSPNVPFGPGTYAINLLATAQTTVTATALVKHSKSQSLIAGKVDMNLFFVGLPNLNATSAQTDANFQSVLTSVKNVWSQVGVSIGTVRYVDITGAGASSYADLKETDLGALMKLSDNPGAADNALNVFFVHTISGGSLDGYIILGESAGIPGAPVRGTSGSGMAVTTADFPNGLADIADTWAHEGSHWLGLFHTTESAGTAFDPLPDTPQCDRSHDANGDNIMQPGECTTDGSGVTYGAENEMFWTSVNAIAHSKLTPNQSFVLLRNPAVH